jgi:predicted nucleotidyltransferase
LIVVNPNETQALQDLQSIASSLGVPIMIIGAGARLLILDWKHDLVSTRTTKDWDLGVKVNSWEEFHRLRQTLLEGVAPSFTPSKLLQRLIHVSGVPVDLVPFGGLARADGTIVWPDDQTEMTVLGFNEAFVHSDWIELGADVKILVVSIPALVVLKLFAFADRDRIDDLKNDE